MCTLPHPQAAATTFYSSAELAAICAAQKPAVLFATADWRALCWDGVVKLSIPMLAFTVMVVRYAESATPRHHTLSARSSRAPDSLESSKLLKLPPPPAHRFVPTQFKRTLEGLSMDGSEAENSVVYNTLVAEIVNAFSERAEVKWHGGSE